MIMQWKRKVGWKGYLDGSSNGFEELFTGYVHVGSRSIIRDGVGVTCMRCPTTLCPYLDHNPSCPIGLW